MGNMGNRRVSDIRYALALSIKNEWICIDSQFRKMMTLHQRSAMKIYIKQLNSQIEDVVLEMRKFLTTSKIVLLFVRSVIFV